MSDLSPGDLVARSLDRPRRLREAGWGQRSQTDPNAPSPIRSLASQVAAVLDAATPEPRAVRLR